MVNHRLIKQVLLGKQSQAVEESVLSRLQEARRQNRLVERDIADWLYARYLAPMVEQAVEFECEIADVSCGGLRAKVIKTVLKFCAILQLARQQRGNGIPPRRTCTLY